MGIENYIWFEKHRPKKISDMSLTKQHKTLFNQFIDDGEIPHLLLEGPQGSGKTTMAHILTSSLDCTVLSLNASGQDRGIDTIKGKVKQFAASQARSKLKIVFMDEADALTKDAQTALRNTMETYSKNCRFILTCNYVDRLISPIQSRCMRFTFDQFPEKRLVRLCLNILDKEGIEGVEKSDVGEIVERFYPDVRSIINSIQAASATGTFDIKAISSVVVDPEEVYNMVKEGKVMSLRKMVASVTDFTFLYRYFYDVFMPNNQGNIENDNKQLMAETIQAALHADSLVADKELNFANCCITMMFCLDVNIDFGK